MKNIPSYGKILTLGQYKTENALLGDVVIQEKVDGSQFKFGLNESGILCIASKSQDITNHNEKMFDNGVAFVKSIESVLLENDLKDTYFYGEYLEKPRHNVLKYNRIPRNHIVIFDVFQNGQWLDRERVESLCYFLGLEVVPELYRGEATIDTIKELLTFESFLGGEIIEGVVIKNYNETVVLGGQAFALFTKFVREAYKERHGAMDNEQKGKNTVETYINSFNSQARWDKALMRLKEKGLLLGESKDIAALIGEVQEDIRTEDLEDIKKFFFNQFIGQIMRRSIQGLPEWYKNKLLENLNTGVNNVASKEVSAVAQG